MTPSSYNVYHITNYDTALRILDGKGIDPSFSQGKRAVSWYVGKKHVTWAIAHTINRKHWTMEEIAVLSVTTERKYLIKTNRTGIYVTVDILYPKVMDSAVMWLQREEQYLHIPGTIKNRFNWHGHNGKGASYVP